MSNKKNKKAKSGKSAKDKLAKGAAAIRKAEADAKAGKGKGSKKKSTLKVLPVPAPPLEIPALARTPEEIVRDRVTMLPGSIGVTIHQDTPLEESLVIFDYVQTMHDHVGFMIGDVLNFMEATYGGDKYGQAMKQTGRANSTLKGYAEVAKAIAPDQRIAALSYSHHREVIRIENPEKRAQLLLETGKAAAAGKAPSVIELRYKVQKIQPKKARTIKKATSGKGKKKGKVVEAYKPDAEEQAVIDAAEDSLKEAAAAIEDKTIQKVLLKVDNLTKKNWSKLLDPFAKLQSAIDRVTGYAH